MQLLCEHTVPVGAKEMTRMEASRETSSFEVKEKKSSSVSLRPMNPVASGDNMAAMHSAHKLLKEELPPLVPCCEGKELQINEDLIGSGLSVISVKHDSVIQCLSMSQASERMQVPPGLVKHRNSFRSLHRPDLKRVPYLRRMTPDELEILFRGYADVPTSAMSINENQSIPPDELNRIKELKDKEGHNTHDEGTGVALRCIPETRSAASDVPAGMRLHGTRARLYTSVLAGANTGNQLSVVTATEEFDSKVPDDPLPEDEVQLAEELQIILPPRCDDVTAESSAISSPNRS